VSPSLQRPADVTAQVPASRPAAAFVPGFDGLRAIAALLVVVVHVGGASGFTYRHQAGAYVARGEIGVSAFFLISGFLLYRPFAAAALAGRPGPGVRSYLLRRALRIVPLYWVVLAVGYLVTGWSSVHGISGLLENAFFLQVYSRDWILHGITQAWSLCIEVTFYLALPLWAAWMRRLGRRHPRSTAGPPSAREVLRRELIALAALYVVSLLFRLWVIAAPAGPTQTGRSWLPAWGDHFALGMGLAVVGSYVQQTGAVPRALRWLEKPGADLGCWVVAAVAYWLAATRIGLSTAPLFVGSAGTDVARQVLYGIFALFLLLPAVFGTPLHGPVRRFLSTRVLSLIGLVSYGVYLWHQLVVRELQAYTPWKVLNAPFLPLLAAAVVVTVGISTVSYLAVERPGIGVGHRWLRRQRERAAALRGLP
jgi:peptidoglycan/LPS O-acetylase OafA/YrhL